MVPLGLEIGLVLSAYGGNRRALHFEGVEEFLVFRYPIIEMGTGGEPRGSHVPYDLLLFNPLSLPYSPCVSGEMGVVRGVPIGVSYRYLLSIASIPSAEDNPPIANGSNGRTGWGSIIDG